MATRDDAEVGYRGLKQPELYADSITLNECKDSISMRVDWSPLFGYDIFLSHKRGRSPAGSSNYARSLKDRLSKADFQCFLHEDDAPAGEHLTPSIQSSLRRSRALVVLCTPEALQSDLNGSRASHWR
jgi:hypothetical protein